MRGFIQSLRTSRLAKARFMFAAPLAYAPGHFYSPICSPAELRRRYRDPAISDLPTTLPGIDLAHDSQAALWDSWVAFRLKARSFATEDLTGRYRILPADVASFDVGDAIVYACMLQGLRPRRLIEVGSGSSSAVALDTFDRFFPKRPRCTFIEPYPALLESLLRPGDKDTVTILPQAVQDVPLAVFDELDRDDILFIDSTHVLKTGSDVAFELFEVLPRLRSGVVVHLHDVFFPFEYPRTWVVEKNFSWNEIYAIRAFLTNNHQWEILFFNDYFAQVEAERMERDAPEVLRNRGGGLWLRRR